MQKGGYVRAATKAGSWYEGDEKVLNDMLDEFLSVPQAKFDAKHVRAIIAPHAGYFYSGATAAHSYKHVNPAVKRIFLLGPSHHIGFDTCALSRATACETPLGHIPVDTETVQQLAATGHFSWIDQHGDEQEHSLELHMPYIAKTLPGLPLVPIMVGRVPKETQPNYGAIFAPYLNNPENFFIISSDFCHWGSRFSYTLYDSTHGDIHEFIEALDKTGMKAIESLEPEKFTEYIRQTKNTICGRMPIALLLHAVKASNNADLKLEFISYAQSSKCKRKTDSSVSYAAGILHVTPTNN